MVKWVRRVEISAAVKPEERRRSKPCGAGVVVVVDGFWAAEELVRVRVGSSLLEIVSLGRRVEVVVWDVYWARREAEVVCARVASEERSAGERASPREQWM